MHPVFLYEYLGSRNGTVIRDYLQGYKGTLSTDGYQPYHTLAKHSDDIKVAGCLFCMVQTATAEK